MACDRKGSRWTKWTLFPVLKAVLYSVSLENQNFENIREVHAMKCD